MISLIRYEKNIILQNNYSHLKKKYIDLSDNLTKIHGYLNKENQDLNDKHITLSNTYKSMINNNNKIMTNTIYTDLRNKYIKITKENINFKNLVYELQINKTKYDNTLKINIDITQNYNILKNKYDNLITKKIKTQDIKFSNLLYKYNNLLKNNVNCNEFLEQSSKTNMDLNTKYNELSNVITYISKKHDDLTTKHINLNNSYDKMISIKI